MSLILSACSALVQAEGVTLHVPADGWQVASFDLVSSIRTDSVDAGVAVAGYSGYSRLAFIARLPSPSPAGKASSSRMAKRALAEAERMLTLVARELRAQAGGLPEDLKLVVVGGSFGADDYRTVVARRAAELFHAGPDAVRTVGGGTALYSVAVNSRGGILTQRTEQLAVSGALGAP